MFHFSLKIRSTVLRVLFVVDFLFVEVLFWRCSRAYVTSLKVVYGSSIRPSSVG